MEIEEILSFVEHKDKYKATTTLKFKKDVIGLLLQYKFKGNILEVGIGNGDTTVVLCKIAEILGKMVYAYDNVQEGINIAIKKCKKCGLNNFEFILKDVYRDKWEIKNIGCVFLDCLHTKKYFLQDLVNIEAILNIHGVVILHDYGLLNKDGSLIADILRQYSNKYKIVQFLGERTKWNVLGSGKAVDWEGVYISIIR